MSARVQAGSAAAAATTRLLEAIERARVQVMRNAQAGHSAYATLIFGRGAASAWLILGASCFDIAAGVAGIVAVTAATSAARLLGYRDDLIQSGFFGYNALLCGLALGHSHAFTYWLLAKAIVAGVVAALLTASLSESLDRLYRLPLLALPFVITLSALAPVLGTHAAGNRTDRWVLPNLPMQLPSWVSETLRAFAAIIFHDSTAAGLLVLLAFIVTSRVATLFGLIGVGLASLLGGFTAPHYHLTFMHVARYNSLLVCVALGCVYHLPSWLSLFWASFGALLAAWLCLVMGSAFAQFNWPLLAWPFVIVTLPMLRAMALGKPRFVPRPALLAQQSPEQNVAFARMLAARFGACGCARVSLPVRGTWTITQGFDGAHTHQGAWRHGLDFELVDSEGFPFKGDGLKQGDYYCFDAPVYAVLPGTVVFAYHDHEDNPPGQQNLVYPYGNVVVIQHGPALFSVLAHLRKGSVTVPTGQPVFAGALIGRCGSSGRSPRPHVHLQMQASAAIGTPTLPFELAHYARASRTTSEYVASGVPREGEQVSGCFPFELPQLAIFNPGVCCALSSPHTGVRHIRSEIAADGERWLHDLETGQRLYFSSLDGIVTFTTYRGNLRSPLRALALALPRVSPFGGEVVARESIPIEWILPGWLRWFHDIMRVFRLGAIASATVHVNRSDRELLAQSDIQLRWFGLVWLRCTAAARMCEEQLTWVRLSRGKRVLMIASQAPAAADFIEGSSAMKHRLKPALAFLTIPIIAIVAASCLLLSPQSSIARAAPNPLADSYRYEASGDIKHAVESMAAAVTVNSHQYFPVLRLAYLEAVNKEYVVAAVHYAQAARLAPEALEPQLGQLKAQLAAEMYAKALPVADNILRVDTKSYTAQSSRAWCLYRLGRYSDAVAAYADVLQMYPGDIEMRLGRAYALVGAKRTVEAGMEFREVLKRAPTERRARAALGLP